jgi:DNA-directed RNA polymerase specialized sigma24 family protein
VSDGIYDRLRSIGVSVETADALAPVVSILSPQSKEAFFLWAMGMSYREISLELGISKDKIYRIIVNIRRDR